jgi:transcriptional regulator with XRE-family HTH domain
MHEVGQRIRRLRKSRNLSLRKLGEIAGLSPSFLSQLERGQTNASIPSLLRVTAALGISTGHLLADLSHELRPERCVDRRPLTSGAYSEYLLSHRPSSFFEIYLGVIRPGDCNWPENAAHGNSEEFCYIISGTVQLYVGESVHTLGPGDSMEYYSSMPHHAENRGTETVELLWVMGPPTIGRTKPNGQPTPMRPD